MIPIKKKLCEVNDANNCNFCSAILCPTSQVGKDVYSYIRVNDIQSLSKNRLRSSFTWAMEWTDIVF